MHVMPWPTTCAVCAPSLCFVALRVHGQVLLVSATLLSLPPPLHTKEWPLGSLGLTGNTSLLALSQMANHFEPWISKTIGDEAI
jgi:hypothetical protein